MNIGKSIKVALSKKGIKRYELAQMLGVTAPTVSVMIGRETCTGEMIKRLSEALQMKASELIALGEE
jgi:plasmid maintenance system antidote protein VapI